MNKPTINRRKLHTTALLSVCVAVFSNLFAYTLYPQRIVTTAPAITEIVFALGKGDKIVGDTNYCNYPEPAKKIPRIGGLMDMNLEVLISMKPDIIFLYPEHYEKLKILEKKARLVTIKHSELKDIFDGILSVSRALNVESRGNTLITSMKQKLDDLHMKSTTLCGKTNAKKIKVLLVIGRNPDNLSNMYIVGAKDFLNELLDAVGGVNAYSGPIKYPSISLESVIAMKPDVIIELSAFNEGIKDEKVIGIWKKFPFIPAVKNNKIRIVKDSRWVIPGPRVTEIAEEMFRMLFDK